MNKSTSVVPFRFESQEVRTVINEESGETWFVARDICNILGLDNVASALLRVPDRYRGVERIATPGGIQKLSIVDESGLYRLILRSDKPNVEPFMEWVTSEVLPTIRKTGSYSADSAKVANPGKRPGMPDTIEPMVTQLKQSIAAAKSFGLEGDAMFDFAERIVIDVTGYSMKAVFSLPEWPKQQEQPILTPPAPPVDQALTVTQLSTIIGDGIGARGLNKLLCQKGVQERHFNDNGVIFYTPTEKGKPYATFFDVAKRNGNKIQQLKWKPGVACLVS